MHLGPPPWDHAVPPGQLSQDRPLTRLAQHAERVVTFTTGREEDYATVEFCLTAIKLLHGRPEDLPTVELLHPMLMLQAMEARPEVRAREPWRMPPGWTLERARRAYRTLFSMQHLQCVPTAEDAAGRVLGRKPKRRGPGLGGGAGAGTAATQDTSVVLFGTTDNNETLAVTVRGWRPWVFLRIPDDMDYGMARGDLRRTLQLLLLPQRMREAVEQRILLAGVEALEEEDLVHDLPDVRVSGEPEELQRYCGLELNSEWLPRKYRWVRVSTATPAQLRRLVGALERTKSLALLGSTGPASGMPVQLAGHKTLLETRFLLDLPQVRAGGWVRVTAGKRPGDVRLTPWGADLSPAAVTAAPVWKTSFSAQVQLRCEVSGLQGLPNRIDLPQQRVVSWDSEAHPWTRAFPDVSRGDTNTFFSSAFFAEQRTSLRQRQAAEVASEFEARVAARVQELKGQTPTQLAAAMEELLAEARALDAAAAAVGGITLAPLVEAKLRAAQCNSSAATVANVGGTACRKKEHEEGAEAEEDGTAQDARKNGAAQPQQPQQQHVAPDRPVRVVQCVGRCADLPAAQHPDTVLLCHASFRDMMEAWVVLKRLLFDVDIEVSWNGYGYDYAITMQEYEDAFRSQHLRLTEAMHQELQECVRLVLTELPPVQRKRYTELLARVGAVEPLLNQLHRLAVAAPGEAAAYLLQYSEERLEPLLLQLGSYLTRRQTSPLYRALLHPPSQAGRYLRPLRAKMAKNLFAQEGAKLPKAAASAARYVPSLEDTPVPCALPESITKPMREALEAVLNPTDAVTPSVLQAPLEEALAQLEPDVREAVWARWRQRLAAAYGDVDEDYAKGYEYGLRRLLAQAPATEPPAALYAGRYLPQPARNVTKYMETGAKGDNKYVFTKAVGVITLDQMQQVKDSVKPPDNSLEYALKHIVKAPQGKVDLPYTRMFNLYERGRPQDLAEIATYADRDAEGPLLVFRKLKTGMEVHGYSRVMNTTMDDVCNRGQQVRSSNLIATFCEGEGYALNTSRSRWPKNAVDLGAEENVKKSSKKARYQGATVIEPKPGYYDQVSTLDFASLYPSTMLTFSLCPGSTMEPAEAQDLLQLRTIPAAAPTPAWPVTLDAATGLLRLQRPSGLNDLSRVQVDAVAAHYASPAELQRRVEAAGLDAERRAAAARPWLQLTAKERHAAFLRWRGATEEAHFEAQYAAGKSPLMFPIVQHPVTGELRVVRGLGTRPMVEAVPQDVNVNEGVEADGTIRYHTERVTFYFAQHLKPVTSRLLLSILGSRKAAKGLKAKAEARAQDETLSEDARKQAAADAMVYEFRQLGLKVCANSIYGFFGADTNPYTCPELAAAVTYFGRNLIELTQYWTLERWADLSGLGSRSDCSHGELKADLHKNAADRILRANVLAAHRAAGGEPTAAAAAYLAQTPYPPSLVDIVYGDTDSIMVHWGRVAANTDDAFDAGEATEGDINHLFQLLGMEYEELEHEKVYAPYILYQKKNYAAKKLLTRQSKPELSAAGIAAVRRDKPQFVRTSSYAVLEQLLFHADMDGAMAAITDTVRRIVLHEHTYRDYVMSKTTKGFYDPSKTLPESAMVRKRRQARGDHGVPPVGARIPFLFLDRRAALFDDFIKRQHAMQQEAAADAQGDADMEAAEETCCVASEAPEDANVPEEEDDAKEQAQGHQEEHDMGGVAAHAQALLEDVDEEAAEGAALAELQAALHHSRGQGSGPAPVPAPGAAGAGEEAVATSLAAAATAASSTDKATAHMDCLDQRSTPGQFPTASARARKAAVALRAEDPEVVARYQLPLDRMHYLVAFESAICKVVAPLQDRFPYLRDLFNYASALIEAEAGNAGAMSLFGRGKEEETRRRRHAAVPGDWSIAGLQRFRHYLDARGRAGTQGIYKRIVMDIGGRKLSRKDALAAGKVQGFGREVETRVQSLGALRQQAAKTIPAAAAATTGCVHQPLAWGLGQRGSTDSRAACSTMRPMAIGAPRKARSAGGKRSSLGNKGTSWKRRRMNDLF